MEFSFDCNGWLPWPHYGFLWQPTYDPPRTRLPLLEGLHKATVEGNSRPIFLSAAQEVTLIEILHQNTPFPDKVHAVSKFRWGQNLR